jgi:pyruvate/2-oxoglutarate dehydrogenase complex dihydrolipoamide dehydrogenase (E3) component
MRWPYCENDRAQAERATDGDAKVVTSLCGRISGATIAGTHAGEVIAPWTHVVSQRLNICPVAEIVVPYSTFSKINERAAMMFVAPAASNPMRRRVVQWLRGG